MVVVEYIFSYVLVRSSDDANLSNCGDGRKESVRFSKLSSRFVKLGVA